MRLSRREFIKTTGAVATLGFVPQAKVFAAPSWNHRIVRARHPLASFFDVPDFEFHQDVPETYYGHWVNQEAVYQMFDDALCALTGEDDPVAAMRRLVSYKLGERVFIKINTTTTYDLWRGDWDKITWDSHYNDSDAIAEPINATLRALVRIGVPQDKISLGDPTWSEGSPDPEKRTPRLVPNRLARKIKAAFPGVVICRSSFMSDGNGITWASNDPHAVVEFRDAVIDRRKLRVTSHRVPDQLIRADHFINLPIMKRHDSAGVTGAFKNNFGTIASCACFHEPKYAGEGKPGAMFHQDGNPAVDIWLNPHVGGKTRLIVTDGIFAGWNWGSDPPTGWKSFGGRSPNCLLLGTDPVAMDSVIFDHVTESLPDKVKDFPPPAMLVDAARIGLGRHES
ncbi:MAG: DUF362 domain-containing protein, partial [Verrucomicrobia bacterium]|nr:DUF362 domain-containing protein [Verrucomicrobiota bacterium]